MGGIIIMAMGTATAMPDALPSEPQPDASAASSTPGLLKLLTFLSPAFPVGAFSYSHGLEWEIDSGRVRSAENLLQWLVDLVELGSGWNDAVLFAAAYRAAHEGNADALRSIAALAGALAPSRERQLETIAQGRAFLEAVGAAWPTPVAARLAEDEGAAYPVAVAAAAASHDIALGDALPVYLNAFAASLVSVGVRLIPIGQNAGLRVLAALHPLIVATAERAQDSTLDDLGAATVLADIASMRHETQYSRVFRT